MPALDGLRGVAIGLVLLEHGSVPGTRYFGTVGVTLFFVLSGYLITGLLLAERERTGHIELGSFYLRRAARLYPALLVMLVAVTWWAPVTGPSAVDAALYTANLHTDTLSPVLAHTWSLAVEVHFYLVWPFVLLLLPRRWVVPVALVGMAASLLLRGDVLSFGTIGNAWALLAGAALAGAGWRLPGPTWSPLRALGRISYGVYLWHYPLVVFNPHVGPWVRAGLIALSVAIAAVSFRWVESPIIGASRRCVLGARRVVERADEQPDDGVALPGQPLHLDERLRVRR